MSSSLQTCRTCLQQGPDYIPLDSGSDSYRHKLITCVPEINVDVMKNPVLCDGCTVKLNEAYKFRCMCIESERKINHQNLETLKKINSSLLQLSRGVELHQINNNKEQYVSDRKRQLSEDEGVVESKKRPRRSSLSELSEIIKQEPQVINDEVDENPHDLLPVNSSVTIKEEEEEEEEGFFYSEYDIDSKENNKVNLTSEEMSGGGVKVSEILTEHSYFTVNVEAVDVEAANSSDKTNNDEDCSSNADSKMFRPFCKELFDRQLMPVHLEVHKNPKSKTNNDEDCSNNNANSKIFCPVCKELFDRKLMSVHMEVHKNLKSVTKPQEDGYLSVKVNTERKFMCRFCNKIFNESDSLYDHINSTHSKENVSKDVLCNICNLVFDRKIIKRHLEVHEAEKKKVEVNADSASQIKLICKVCGDIFADEKLFTTHYHKHKQSQAMITCEVCGETYDQGSAKAHMEFHNIVEEIVLNGDVDESTFSPPNVEAEKASTSNAKSSTNYTCCAEHFSNLYLLHLHTTKVHGYVCYVCNIKFPNRQALGGHFRVHNEEKSHQCKDCGKYFAQRGNLLRHTHFVHHCVMPYKCDKCGQRFRRNKYLEEHMRGHTQRYICGECDRVFTELKLLRRHKRYHTPRPHQCDLCNTVFTAKSSLVRHKKDIHKVKITGKRSYGLGDVVLGSNEEAAQ